MLIGVCMYSFVYVLVYIIGLNLVILWTEECHLRNIIVFSYEI